MILGSVAMMWGWLRSFFKNAPRYDDKEFRAFVNRYQWACLLKGKRRATAELEARQVPVWRPPDSDHSYI
jgi:hypothetical protein